MLRTMWQSKGLLCSHTLMCLTGQVYIRLVDYTADQGDQQKNKTCFGYWIMSRWEEIRLDGLVQQLI